MRTRAYVDGHRRMIAAVFVILTMAAASSASLAQDVDDVVGVLQDAIVGTWVGTAALPEQDAYQVRMTFVSPKGGIVRYPGETPCGGILTGDRKGDDYEYQETITFNGLDERDDGCFDGLMRLSVDGDTMKFEWSGTHNGQEHTASGELKRQRKRAR